MSKSSMHISVSGGNAVIGNISQGHGNQIHAEQEIPLTAEQLEYFYQALDELIADKKIAREDYLALKNEIKQLQQRGAQSTVGASLEALCKKYAWAAVPLKALLGL